MSFVRKWALKVPRWVLSGVCFLAICYLTLVPKPLPDNDFSFWEHTDKVVHAIMFGGMYFCLYIDKWRGERPKAWKCLVAALAVALFGGLIEIAQQGMALGRGGDVADFAADCVGIAVSALLCRLI